MTPTLEPNLRLEAADEPIQAEPPESLRRRLVLAAVAMLLLAALSVLVMRSSRHPFDFNEVSTLIRDMKQVDAQWNADVLGVQAGLQPNFDRMVLPLQRMPELAQQLRQRVDQYAVHDALAGVALKDSMTAYDTAFSEKVDKVERIKSALAILRNSSRYLPVANDQLIEDARLAGMGRTELEALQLDLNRLMSGVLSQVLSADVAGQGWLRDELERMRARMRTSPAGVAAKIELLLTHLDLVQTQRETTARLLAEVAALPVVPVLDALHDRFGTELERSLTSQQLYRLALGGFAAALLGLLAWAGWQLHTHMRMLKAANRTLQATNHETQMLLVQSSKMSAIGQMVAGIAHEVNSPLAYVKSALSMLREILQTTIAESKGARGMGAMLTEKSGVGEAMADLHDAEERREVALIDDINTLLDDGLHGIDQITQLILTLKNFSRIDRAKKVDFMLDEGLNSALTIARYLLKRTVDVRKEYSEGIPPVHCTPSQINQVFLNIITNAAQAMAGRSEKGQITLRTSRHSDTAVRVDIQDNGSGIPPDVLPRVFEPFFTTKPAGEGTGAGLAICKQIIAKHGGEIRVESKLGVGTTFSIILPIAETSAQRGIKGGSLALAS